MNDAMAMVDGWVEKCRDAYVEAIQAIGHAPVTFVSLQAVDISSDGQGFRFQVEPHEVSLLSIPQMKGEICRVLRVPDIEPLRTAAKSLLEKHGPECLFWAPMSVSPPFAAVLKVAEPKAESDPVEWLVGRLLAPIALEYVQGLVNITVPNAALRNQLVEQAFAFAAASTWTSVESVCVSGLLTDEDSLRIGDLSLRRLSRFETGERTPAYVGLSDRGFHGLLDSTPPSHRLELRTPSPKTAQAAPPTRPQRMLLALQLLGFEPAGDHVEQSVEPRWAYVGRMGVGSGLPRRSTTPKNITHDDLSRACELAKNISERAFTAPKSARDIALHRFHLAMRRAEPIDRLIDLTVALEAFLLPGMKAELSYRFGLNGALWLADTVAHRRGTYSRLREIYEARSTIIHGTGFMDGKLAELVSDAATLTRQCLLKGLQVKWPSQEDFLALILGTGADVTTP